MTEEKQENTDIDVEVKDTVAQTEMAEDIEDGSLEEVSEEQAEGPVQIDLTEELEQTRAQAAEYLDGWQRTRAEFSNYKKRQEAERAQMIALANSTLLRRLLPAVDDFGRALATLPANLSQMTWIEGIVLIKHKLDAVLESEGVKPIDTEGQTFDPHYHDAVTYEEAEGYGDGQIIGEVQRGYTLGERVLRPALVRVAKAPARQVMECESVEDTDSDTNDEKE